LLSELHAELTSQFFKYRIGVEVVGHSHNPAA
jgi:hypothetical protein